VPEAPRTSRDEESDEPSPREEGCECYTFLGLLWKFTLLARKSLETHARPRHAVIFLVSVRCGSSRSARVVGSSPWLASFGCLSLVFVRVNPRQRSDPWVAGPPTWQRSCPAMPETV
jgi:hypothetical protein